MSLATSTLCRVKPKNKEILFGTDCGESLKTRYCFLLIYPFISLSVVHVFVLLYFDPPQFPTAFFSRIR
jgi:hypothetical protein